MQMTFDMADKLPKSDGDILRASYIRYLVRHRKSHGQAIEDVAKRTGWPVGRVVELEASNDTDVTSGDMAVYLKAIW